MSTYAILETFHVIGLAMTFGGILTSFLITLRYKGNAGADKGAFVASHLVAAPGLVLVIISGLSHTALMKWSHFSGSGYMHGKMLLVVLLVIFLGIDIRAQGISRRAADSANREDLVKIAARRRTWAGILAMTCLLLIIFMIEFRPF